MWAKLEVSVKDKGVVDGYRIGNWDQRMCEETACTLKAAGVAVYLGPQG